MSSDYDNDSSDTESTEKYEKMELREHILRRPENYIGSCKFHDETLYVIKDGKMVQQQVHYVPGLYKIFDEILVNAADNTQKKPPTKNIKVTINQKEGYISVWNDGRSIPLEKIKDPKDGTEYWAPEFIFGLLLTSSNYDDSQKRVVGGRNGYGAKLANIYSNKFIVECVSPFSKFKSGYAHYKQTFSDHMIEAEKAEPKETNKKSTSTCITFYPDVSLFGMEKLDDDIVALMSRRVWDMAGILKDCTVYLNDKKLPITKWEDYCKLYLPTETTEIVPYESGRWKIAIAPSDGQYKHVSFVNGVNTSRGGTHVDYIASQVAGYICKALAGSRGDKKVTCKPFQAKLYLTVFVNALIENPTFDSQTKDTLTLPVSGYGSTCELPEPFMKKIMKTEIPGLIRDFARFKEKSSLKRMNGKKAVNLHDVPKLKDANDAGTSKSQQCTLILTEGDSARASAITGLSIIGHDRYGVFPLRGKMLNTRDISATKFAKNEEIKNVMKIMGLRTDERYETDEAFNNLRYGSIMIMADQDVDGSHIKGLIINFIHSMWPALIKRRGFLCEFITPIIKATKGKKKNRVTMTFYTIPEFIDWKTENNNAKGWVIKYYKGLATSQDDEVKEYFRDFKRHKINFRFSGENDEERIQLAFSKKRADDRKDWLANLDPETTYLGQNEPFITYTDFVDKELILFSNYANTRAIPSVVDGLKPGQRKILWVSLKTNIVNELKVNQLAGKVSEQSAYHHGEDSLCQTIVGMTEKFVGSNNINLLDPIGQCGTRLKGGADAGAPRYIHTKLTKLARAIYPKDDDQLLFYLTDEGTPIEPKYYVPIIPMVLVNGSSGIGVGWSSLVPCFNPRDLVRNIKHKLHGEPYEDLTPWYFGFTGKTTPIEGRTSKQSDGEKTKRWRVTGKAEIISEDCIRISELPIQEWTDDYKLFLQSLIIDKDSKKEPTKGGKKGKKDEKGKDEGDDNEKPKKRGGGRKKKAAAEPQPQTEDESSQATSAPTDDEDSKKRKAAPLPKFDGPKITTVKEYCSNDNVLFDVYVTEEQMEYIKKVGLETFFKLSKTINTSNMTLFSPEGKIKQYQSPEEILEDFYKVRYGLYEERKMAVLENLSKEAKRLSNQARFIKEFIEKTIELRNIPQKDIMLNLKNRGFDQITGEDKIPKRVEADAVEQPPISGQEEEDEDEVASNDLKALKKGYDYLLSMKIWTLTKEKYNKLLRQVENINNEVKRIDAMTVVDMWEADLDNFMTVYDNYERKKQESLDVSVADSRKSNAKSKSKVRIPRKSNKAKTEAKETKTTKAKAGANKEEVDQEVDQNAPPEKKTVKKETVKKETPKKAAVKKETPKKKEAVKKEAPKKNAKKKKADEVKVVFEDDDDSDDIEEELSFTDDEDEAEPKSTIVTNRPRRAAAARQTKLDLSVFKRADESSSSATDGDDDDSEIESSD